MHARMHRLKGWAHARTHQLMHARMHRLRGWAHARTDARAHAQIEGLGVRTHYARTHVQIEGLLGARTLALMRARTH